MKPERKKILIILAVMSALFIILSLSLCSCGKPFPYQGTLAGNWSGQLTILGRTIPVGGTITIIVDAKGVGTGTVNLASGGSAPAKLTAQVDSSGNLTGAVSFTISATTFNSNWQGKIAASGNTLDIQGTWTSQHGSGTFSGAGTSSN